MVIGIGSLDIALMMHQSHIDDDDTPWMMGCVGIFMDLFRRSALMGGLHWNGITWMDFRYSGHHSGICTALVCHPNRIEP